MKAPDQIRPGFIADRIKEALDEYAGIRTHYPHTSLAEERTRVLNFLEPVEEFGIALRELLTGSPHGLGLMWEAWRAIKYGAGAGALARRVCVLHLKVHPTAFILEWRDQAIQGNYLVPAISAECERTRAALRDEGIPSAYDQL